MDAKWKTELDLRENKTIFANKSLHLDQFTLYRIALAPARKPYRIWLLFTHRGFCNGAKLCRVDLNGQSHIGQVFALYTG